MGYCYAHKISAAPSKLIHDLREELYTCPYSTIDWPSQRNNIAPGDVYTPHSWLLDIILSKIHRVSVLSAYEMWAGEYH